MIKVVHFINQFYAGFGSEDFGDTPTGFFNGPKGPGIALQRAMNGKDGQAGQAVIAATIYSGDNFSNERQAEFLAQALACLEEQRPDVLVAGPAFNSGRYGMACANLLRAAREKLGIPGVTGFGPDNPGNDFRKDFWIVPTGLSSAGMGTAIEVMARIALKLGAGVPLGPAAEEGYLPRGFRLNVQVGEKASKRAVDMALARLSGRPWETEVPRVAFDEVNPPAPVPDLSRATVALVCEGSLVPAGNPDHLETWNATKWLRYPLSGDKLEPGRYEGWHGGYITTWVHEDPNRMVPLDAMRALEKEGVFGRLHDEYLVTTGNMTNVSTMQKLGREMGTYLKEKGIDAAILTAT